MNWLFRHLMKEARHRRFNPNDSVRYFTEQRKGKGRGIVLTPRFNRGVVVDFNADSRRYRVRDNSTNEELDVHPRNIIPETMNRVDSPVMNPVDPPVMNTEPEMAEI